MRISGVLSGGATRKVVLPMEILKAVADASVILMFVLELARCVAHIRRARNKK